MNPIHRHHVPNADDVADLIEQAIQAEGAAFDDNGIEIVRDYGHVGPIRLNRDGLSGVLRELIRNAVAALLGEHRPAGRVLRVSLSLTDYAAGLSLRIEVQDNGVGIPPAQMPRIFSNGFTTRPGQRGTGLFRAFASVQQMGGTLSVASAGEGRGATFVLELPVQRPDEKDRAAE